MSTGNACFTLGPPEFSPKNYPGLVAWYNIDSAIVNDADINVYYNDESVAAIRLKDNSDNNNILILSNEASFVNKSLRSIEFTNNTYRNSSPLEFASEPTGLTVFLVANNNTNTDPSDIDIDEYQNYLTIFQNQSNKPIHISINKYINNELGFNLNSIIMYSDQYRRATSLINPNTINIINAICFNSNVDIQDNNISSAAVYQNGNLSYYVESNSVLRVNTDINTFNIIIGDDGTDDGRTHVPLNTTIYEIIIYNRVLSENDISNINKHLGEKYIIPLTNDGNFTYKQDL